MSKKQANTDYVTAQVDPISDHISNPPSTDHVKTSNNALKNKKLTTKIQANTDYVTTQVDHISNDISKGTRDDISSSRFLSPVEFLIKVLQTGEQGSRELMEKLGLKGYMNYKYGYLNPALESGFIEMTQPDSPRSPTQKYRLTAKGFAVLKNK